jgi:hypothetical protein
LGENVKFRILLNEFNLAGSIAQIQKEFQYCELVLRRKEEGGFCGPLLYLSSITRLHKQDYSCQDSKSR